MPISAYSLARLEEIVGREHVATDRVTLQVYEYDGALTRAPAAAVVFPGNTEQVRAVMRFCCRKRIPVTPRGSGTCLSGGPVPVQGGVVLEMSRLDRLLEVDRANQRVVCEPGYLNFDLVEALAAIDHLYAPDPSSQKACTMGGNVAENSGGPHCFKYGVTTNHVTGLTVVLPDGDVQQFGGKTLEAPGYDLRGLFIGSEGTFGVATEIICRILPSPEAVVTMLAVFDSLAAASEAVSGIIADGMIPATLEMMDKPVIQAVEKAVHAGYPLDAEAVLIIELDGMRAGLPGQMERVERLCRQNGVREFRYADDPAERELLWRGRKGAFGAVAAIAPNKLVTDVAVPRTELPRVLAEVMRIGERHGVKVGNVFHAGDGNLHPQLLYDDRDEDLVRRVKAADKEITKLAIEAGGVLTGEHGIGCQKVEAMPLMCSPVDLAAMRWAKEVFDPAGICNPGKVLPPAAPEEGRYHQVPQPGSAEPLAAERIAAASYAEAAAALAQAAAAGQRVAPVGSGTKLAGVPEGVVRLSSSALQSLQAHDWANLTVTVEAGARLDDLQQVVAARGQFVPLSAPFGARATIGGIIAANSNGPHRLGYGDVRDVLLGLKVALTNGAVMNNGATTVKNVSGYDLRKLFIGSEGSLGMVVEATFRTLPLPEASRTLLCLFPGIEAGGAMAAAVRFSKLLPSALELLDAAAWNAVAAATRTMIIEEEQAVLAVALRGAVADVEQMERALREMAPAHGGMVPIALGAEQSEVAWRHIAELSAGGGFAALERAAWRVLCPPGDLPALALAVRRLLAALGLRGCMRGSAGSGVLQVLVAVNPSGRDAARVFAHQLSAAAEGLGGYLVVDMPGGVAPVLTPRRTPSRLEESLKARFDPAGVLPPIPGTAR